MKNVVLLNFSMSSFEISYYFHVHIPHLRQRIRPQLFRILASKSTRKIPAKVSIIAIFNFTLTICICMMKALASYPVYEKLLTRSYYLFDLQWRYYFLNFQV